MASTFSGLGRLLMPVLNPWRNRAANKLYTCGNIPQLLRPLVIRLTDKLRNLVEIYDATNSEPSTASGFRKYFVSSHYGTHKVDAFLQQFRRNYVNSVAGYTHAQGTCPSSDFAISEHECSRLR